MRLKITDKAAVLKYNPAFEDIPEFVTGIEFRPAFALYVCCVDDKLTSFTLKVKKEHCRPARRKLFGGGWK